MSNPKTWISLAILALLALHPIPIAVARVRKTMWPILAWSMYKDSRPAGPISATKRRLVGVTASGEEVELGSGDAGSSGFAFQTLYLRQMWLGDTSAARQLFAKINNGRPDPFVEFRLEGDRYTVADSGIVKRSEQPIIYRETSQAGS